MKTNLGLCALLLVLNACATPIPDPVLPEGAATKSFVHTAESFKYGMRGDINRDPVVLEARYSLNCLADRAQSRFAAAKKILDEKFSVAPLTFDNPREHGSWRRSASFAVSETGCIVDGLTDTVKIEEEFEVWAWALLNKVPPAR